MGIPSWINNPQPQPAQVQPPLASPTLQPPNTNSPMPPAWQGSGTNFQTNPYDLQQYGYQQGPGQIGIGNLPDQPGGPTTPPYSGSTNPNTLFTQQSWNKPYSSSVLANNKVSADPWDSVSHNNFTQQQDWQNFTFDNPTETWQKNFNQLDGMDKWRYGMGTSTGNPAVMKMALIAKGIDPTQAAHIVDAFGTGSNQGYRKELGMGDNPWYTNGAGMLQGPGSTGVRGGLGMIQEGNQLWGMDGRGNRYLVKDFQANGGNGGWQNLANMGQTGNLYNNQGYMSLLNQYGNTSHGKLNGGSGW